jgi:hypothetical protein
VPRTAVCETVVCGRLPGLLLASSTTRTEMVRLASAIHRRRTPDGNRDGNDGSHQQPGPPWLPADWSPSERAIRLTLAEAFRSEGRTSSSSTW